MKSRLSMQVCHPHNLGHPAPSQCLLGIRVSLKPGDPFANLVGSDWRREHWYPTERERDGALAEMSSRHPFSRIGDQPALVFEKIERPAAAR